MRAAIIVLGIIGVEAFNRSLDRRLDAAGISAATRQALAPERAKLGAMKAPPGTGEPEARAIQRAVKTSLDSTFRVVTLTCAALALLAAACAAWGVRNVSMHRRSAGST